MPKKAKKIGSDLRDKLVRVQSGRAMTHQQWEEAGKPYWLLAADEAPPDAEYAKLVYYRLFVPAYKPLNVLARTTKDTKQLRAGVILDGSTPPPPVDCLIEPWNVAEEVITDDYGFTRLRGYNLWGRDWTEATAQHYDKGA